jgi:hypothetical protein
MAMIFRKKFEEGKAVISQEGFVEGLNRLDEAHLRMEFSHGHIEYVRGFIPRIVLDTLMLENVMGTIAPKAFDILSVDKDTGTLTLTRCKWQTQEKYYSHADISLTAQTGTVCAVLDTTDGTLTAQMDYVWTDTAPELIPYALYDITVSTVDKKQVVVIDCDRRGSAITFYG